MAISYTGYTITPDCSGLSQGSFDLTFQSTAPNTNLNWVVYPQTYTASTATTYTSYTNTLSFTGLPSGNYIFNLQDQNSQVQDFQFYIVSSTTMTLSAITDTSCGLNNGFAVAYVNQTYGSIVNLYNQNGFYASGTSLGSPVGSTYFTNLEPGVYYATASESNGCTASSNSISIQSSNELNFGLYVVNNSNCGQENGKIFVTGLTGVGPFIYQWQGNNVSGFTGSSITGLSSSGYVVTVTDALGCSKSQSATISTAQPLSIINYIPTTPTCFNNDGAITFNFSGGSTPYYYYLSNGDSQTILSNQVTFTGLTTGNYTLTVLDGGLCSYSTSVNLNSPSSFSVISSQITDGTCTSNGSISINIRGGSPPFTASLSGQTTPSQTITTLLNGITFNNLSNDNYVVSIVDSISGCTYTESFSIGTNSNIEFELSQTGTTCGSDNGTINVTITNPVSGETYTYGINNGQISSVTTASTYDFTSLSSGIYTVTVTNSSYCSYSKLIYVEPSQRLNVSLYSTACSTGSDGTISALIQVPSGYYDLFWSPNVSGQTGTYVTGLTAGYYTLTVSGSNNCLTSQSVEIVCTPPLTSTSYSFKYSSGKNTNFGNNKFNLTNMYFSGFSELTIGSTNCLLSSATFSFKISLDGNDYEYPFYYTVSSNDLPTMEFLAGIIQSTVESIPNIVSCTVDAANNSINVVANSSNGVEYYNNETLQFVVIIDYAINCVSVNNIVC